MRKLFLMKFPIRMIIGFWLGVLFVSSLVPSLSIAQETAQDESIKINAEEGIDWLRDEFKYIARGNAIIERANIVLRADLITAIYRETGGKQEVYRADAIGRVIMKDGESTANGDKAVYHLDTDIVVMIGRDLKLTNQQGVITARDSLEYWNGRKIAVARGDATVVQGDKIIRAGALTAFIDEQHKPKKKDNAPNTGQIVRIDATDGVHISTKDEILIGKEGVYDVPKQVFRICGDVKITRGDSQLNGNCANLDMVTGRSRLEGGNGKVQGLIIPSKKN